jgi:hypothetical protein
MAIGFFFVLKFGNIQPSGIYQASLDRSGMKRLISADSGAVYALPGYLLFADQGVLVARSFNLKNGIIGNPVPIARPVGTDHAIWRGGFSVSNAGVLAHRTNASARRQLVWVDRAGNRLSVVGGIDDNSQQRDGATISVSAGGGIAPRWRRDGKELFYVGQDGTLIAVAIRISADGRTLEPGARERLFHVPIVGGGSMVIGGMQQYAVSADGQRFLINMTISEANIPITVVLKLACGTLKVSRR